MACFLFVCFFSFFMLFHLSLTLFRPDVPFKVSNGFLNVMYQSIPSLTIPPGKTPSQFFLVGEFGGGGGRVGGLRIVPPSLPPPLIFKAKFKIFVTLPS